MKRWNDVEAVISEPSIDKRTEEKMFFGNLDPGDAPPEFARVAVLLRAAAAPRLNAGSGSLVTDTEKLRQHVGVAMAAAIAAAPEGPLAPTPGHGFWKAMSAVRPGGRGRARTRARLVLVMALGLMIASAGMAFAGVLPSPVQHAASVLLSKVGVHVPDRGHGHEGTGSGKEPGSASGHDKVTGSGDHGNGTDHGKHSGQGKNGNGGKHQGQGKGHSGEHGKSGEHGNVGHQSGKGKSGEPHGQNGGNHGHSGDHGGNGGNGNHGNNGNHGGHHGHDEDGGAELGAAS